MSGRVPALVLIKLLSEGDIQKGVSIDLSLGGVSILMAHSLEKGMTYRATLFLKENTVVQAEVRVAYTSVENIQGYGERPLAGLNFVRISREEKRKLEQYIHEFRYYSRTFRPSKDSGHLRVQNLKKAAAMLGQMDSGDS